MTNIAGHEDEDSEGHEINRCFKPSTFGKVNEFRLHHFSDASEEGYGQVSYLINTDERIHCCFLGGKARVTLKKVVSMPHLELIAAVLLVKVANFLKTSKLTAFVKHIDLIVKLYLIT